MDEFMEISQLFLNTGISHFPNKNVTFEKLYFYYPLNGRIMESKKAKLPK